MEETKGDKGRVTFRDDRGSWPRDLSGSEEVVTFHRISVEGLE